VGTSGYDYPDWEGPFYPRGLGRAEYLGAYSEAFGTLELGFPGSGIPAPGMIRELMGRTRRPVDFAVKAGSVLTRDLDPAGWKTAAAAFAASMEPLAGAGRLCAVLMGFPFGFRYRDDERRYLDRVLREFAAFPLVVEFGNAEWFTARVIEGLKTRAVGLCSSDLPRMEGLPPVSDLVTSDLAYVRFHGRDGVARTLGATQGEYRYSSEELRSWLPRLEAMSIEARKLRVFFTNHRGGNAAADARELLRLAKAARLV
jgi:uncharacterized protein YecE (DUF72 family)